jgi:hypothetical protein
MSKEMQRHWYQLSIGTDTVSIEYDENMLGSFEDVQTYYEMKQAGCKKTLAVKAVELLCNYGLVKSENGFELIWNRSLGEMKDVYSTYSDTILNSSIRRILDRTLFMREGVLWNYDIGAFEKVNMT